MKCDARVLEEATRRALEAWRARDPVTMLAWAEKHFRLSDADYTQGKWVSWKFQRAIMLCIGDDRVEEVTCRKAARMGWTAILRIAVGYFAQHKRRTQVLWQASDGDRDDFVKDSIDPLLRDVPVMREVMPNPLSRHKDNTLELKTFVGSKLYLRGGRAAANYRRISPTVCYLDEVDAFDRDIEREGSPFKLAWRRNAGAVFRKRVAGSSPKEQGSSLIESREMRADVRYRYEIACPECGDWHEMVWHFPEEYGEGATQPDGIVWLGDNPETVRHRCPHCACEITQEQFLGADDRWKGSNGTIMTAEGGRLVVRTADGTETEPERHVAFFCWAAVSPDLPWSDIVREYQDAAAKMAEGDDSLLKTFTNTVLGRTYAGEVDGTDADDLKARAEPFSLGICPRDCLLLLAGVDTQDNRLEVGVWGYGRGCETWTIDHRVIFGDPGQDDVWLELEDWFLNAKYQHVAGTEIKISGTGIDSGGHNTHAVYEFARTHRSRDVYATKGRNRDEKAIKDGATPVDIDWRGKKRPKGVLLWHIGTNLAKDLIYSRLGLTKPGPGYIHFSNELPDEWFRQFAAEVRRTAANGASRWTAIRKRNEVLDCRVGVTWLEEHMELRRKPESWWLELERRVRPPPVVPDPAVEMIPQVVQAETRRKFGIQGGRFGRAAG